MLLTGSQIVVEILKEQNTKKVFGYPGGHILQVYHQLGKNREYIDLVLTSHEQGAAHAADGYARSTGDVGVCIATSGPGVTNLVTGLATALADSIPVVAITGNVPLSLAGTDSFQEIDAISLTVAVTKHSFFVRNIEELQDTLREAFQIAKSGRPGPVLVDIPQDVQLDFFEFEPVGKVEKVPIPVADISQVEDIIPLIENSNKPIIYCGGGVTNGNCQKELIEFAEKIDAYVVCTLMGVAAVDSNHDLCLGMAGVYGRHTASLAISEADLIIAAGSRFSDRSTGNKDKFAEKAKIVHLDIDEAEKGKIIHANKNVTGDLKQTLVNLIELSPKKNNDQWHKDVTTLKERFGEECFDKKYFKPKEIIETVNKNVPKDTVVCTDVGQHQMWVAKHYNFSVPRTFLSSGGFGTMGYGMGAAIGAALGTEKRSVLFTGDGSFHMNMNELATAVRYDVPVTVVVLNNGGLGMIKQLQTFFCNNSLFGIELDYKTNFKELAAAMGATGYRAETMEELETAIIESFQSTKPTVIDCIISFDDMATPMMSPKGGVYDMLR